MSDFVDKLKLAEKAAEDIYFAKVNRELIDKLHKRMEAEQDTAQQADPSSAETQTEDTTVLQQQAAKKQ